MTVAFITILFFSGCPFTIFLTVSSAGTRDSVCKLAAVMATGSTSDQAYYFGPISVAALFGGVLPKKFQVFVVHSTAVSLNGTAANQAIYITGTYNTVT